MANDFGRVAGTVADPQGNPIGGATILITGPILPGVGSLAPSIERILSDASGKFSAEHLLPGYYSLRVTSPTRVPETRAGVRVMPGETIQERFVLTDIFASIRIQPPSSHLSNLREDWKWVLRTSASTRPVLRLTTDAQTAANEYKPLPPAERVVGISPGVVGREAEDFQQGTGALAAYLQPLSSGADLLVAASMPGGSQAVSLAASLRRGINSGNPQEISLAVQQLGLGAVVSGSGSRTGKTVQGRAVVSKYQRTTRLSKSVALTGGVEMDYVDAMASVATARPHVTIEYHRNDSNTVTIRFGELSPEADPTISERVALLNLLPQVTLDGNRVRLVSINHTEAAYGRKLGQSSSFEIAAYRDGYGNAVARGFGDAGALSWLGQGLLIDPVNHSLTFNAGNYSSNGARAVFKTNLGSHLETALVYTTGEALAAISAEATDHSLPANLREALSVQRSESFTAKVTARIPASKTEITTSYQWLQHGRVTNLDPYELAALQIDPFLGIQVRQALPAMAFLPAHLEASADFQNLLAQGYVPVSRGGEQFTLTPAYRTIRGGLSVEF